MDNQDDGSSISSSSLSSLDMLDTHPDVPPRGNATKTLEKRKTGRKKFKETRHPIYKGVRRKNGGNWVSEIREPNKKSRIWPSAEIADVAALALCGEKAVLNFSDSAWSLKPAKSSSPYHIRAAVLQMNATSSSHSFSVDFQDNTESDNTVAPFEVGLGRDTNVEKSKCDHGLTLVSSSSVVMQNEGDSPEVYVDEEAVFNMPNFYNSMAEGLVITPPAMEEGFDWEGDHAMDLTLW